MKSGIALGVVGFGLMLLVFSSIWSTLFPPTSSWTPEKASRISEVKARLNDLSFVINDPRHSMHSGPDRGELKAEADTLLKEFEQLKADFESATERPQIAAKVLKWTGISLAIVGIIGWYAVKNMDS